MAIFPRMTLLAIAAVTAVALSGCLAPTPEPTPSPVPSADPVFASEEEALAAATEAYAAYLEVSDQIAVDGGAEVGRVSNLVSARYLSEQVESYAAFARSDLRISGATTFEPPTLQTLEQGADNVAHAAVYVCVDVSSVRLIDSSGADKTPADRVDKYPLVVSFDSAAAGAPELIIDASEPWTGANFCSSN